MPTRNEESPITLTSDEVLDFALDTLLKGVKLYINGYKCTAQNVYEIVLKASAGQTSVNNVCDDLKGTPKGNTVLGQLHPALPQKLSDLWRLEVKLNRVLLLNVPKRMLRVRCDLAIDLVLVPYHGEPAKDAEEVKRSAARHGVYGLQGSPDHSRHDLRAQERHDAQDCASPVQAAGGAGNTYQKGLSGQGVL